MANLAVVAASVKQVVANNSFLDKSHLAGGTLTAGMAVVLNGSSKWVAGQADGTIEEAGSLGAGIILHGASLDQPAVVALTGATLNLGVATENGEVYVISATVGLIAEIADITSGQYITILGYGDASDQFIVNILRIPFAKA